MKRFIDGLFAGLTCLCMAGIPATVTAQEAVVLRAVVPVPVMVPIVAPVKNIYIPGLSEATKGKLKVNLIGGPEAIPPNSQVDAVRKGIVDIAFTWVSDYRHLVPVSGAMHLSPYTPWEEREKGIFDYWVKMHEPIQVRYIGRWAWGMQYNFHMRNKKVTTLADFKGVKMDDPINIHAIPKAFGMVPLEISGPDIYTALERGVADGYIWSNFGRYRGWEKVTKYVLDEPFLQMDMAILINQKVYDNLSDDLKRALAEYTARYEREATKWYIEQVAKETQRYKEAGVEFLKLSPAESRLMVETAEKVAWEEDVKPSLPAEVYNEVRRRLTK